MVLIGATTLLAAPRYGLPQADVPALGVSHELAEFRGRRISDVQYDLSFALPEQATQPIRGTATIRFQLTDPTQAIVLDFDAPAENIFSVRRGNADIPYRSINGHIILEPAGVIPGAQQLTIGFQSTDAALNRHDDFMYTLFVPDRAATAFPCFNQPDLKARYRLSLTVPAAWRAVANGSVEQRDSGTTTQTLQFGVTAPISTYLFAFAAGKLFVETAERDGRQFHMYHRETDSAKVAKNREAIFDLHAAALRWLEQYTGIPYPFGKFDFFAIPSFQFGGMEHPGSVWYRAQSLFLDASATRNQFLGRASVISHETAHMWFGDLVTMRWFDDVWMKEVFANFMADKIVRPSFPDINHDLRFFLAHHPGAYDVDRTVGTNPIRQPLENLREAGSLYGAIIYEKAPIVLRQLEILIGDSSMRRGLREYLNRFQFANASWPELIAILSSGSSEDLQTWSHVWVEETGRPSVRAVVTRGPNSTALLTVSQTDPRAERRLQWNQQVDVALGYGDSTVIIPIHLRDSAVTVSLPSAKTPDFLVLGGDGVAYGRFALDAHSRVGLLTGRVRPRGAVVRSVAWNGLWEGMLAGDVPPHELLQHAIRSLPTEGDELIIQQILGLLQSVYWRYITPSQRTAFAPTVERVLWQGLTRAPSASRKGAYYNAIVSTTLTVPGIAKLERIWRKTETVPGLPLAEDQYIDLAQALAVRDVPNSRLILDSQETRIANPDRRARFRFVRPALSPHGAVRDSVFASLRGPANRRREPWVLEVISYLHHPLRAAQAERYIEPSLALVEEVQRTGDIFFPLGWLHATLDGHQTKTAAEVVSRFLAQRPEYPPRLRGKILQAADGLFTAARLVDRYKPTAPLVH